MLIPDRYRRIEKERGRSLREMGSKGVAFTRGDILAALDTLRGGQVAVLGGDVLKAANGRLRHTYDSWHADRLPEEGIEDYMKRSIEQAEGYVRNYPDPEDGTILYRPVISELGVVGSARD